HLGRYSELGESERAILHDQTIKHVVQVIDGYLLATVLLIFALGLYELFISRIDQADTSTSSRILSIRNLDDLKNRLAKVILMILVVKFFDHAISMKFDSSYDMLSFAGGIALIGLALFLTHASERHGGTHDDDANHRPS
ncbi:MAG TPA: YqhA family protein, partial [Thermopetrobacter sp.]|nr:YqhA family protein [Thermopetrobacter sp.]